MKLLLALLVGALLLAPPAAPAAEREADRAVSSNPARDIVDTGVPGAVVLDRNGVHAAGNVRAHSRFRAGSVTKTFVATVVLQLVEEGRLSLDRPVPGSRGIPVRRLLDHTSGIFNHAEDPRVFAEGLLKRWRPRQLVAISRSHPPYFPPGSDWHYSNTNYVLLGLAIERVTGRPLAVELERRIIRPLRLRATRYDEGPIVPAVAPGRFEGTDVTVQDTSWAGASGALVSTARDLSRFYRALVGGRLLRPSSLAAMTTPDPVAGPYGLGVFRLSTPCGDGWGHDGAVPGYLAQAFAAPDGRRAVVLVNQQPLDERQEEAVRRAVVEAFCSR